MKIKRLTAGLAVAAMAATFFAAAPMLSAQAVALGSAEKITPMANYGTVYAGGTANINIIQLLGTDSATSGVNKTWVDGNQHPLSAFNTFSPNWIDHWACTSFGIVDPTNWPALMKPGDGSQGTLTCDAQGNLIYTPALAMGFNGDADVTLFFQVTGYPNDDAQTTFTTNTTYPWLEGYITLTVQQKPDTSGCQYANQAQCLTADLQAFAKKDGPASAKIDVISPNVKFTDKNGNVTGFITGDGNWGIYSIDSASSVDNSIKSATLMSWVTYGTGKGANLIKFTLPATQYNWSGTVSYVFTLAQFNCGPGGVVPGTTNACGASIVYGLATFVVHPTLTAPDDLTTDQGAAVTVPLLGADALPIIGTAPFQDASCTFADTKAKTTLSGVGSIKNPGGSKNPVFTPVADFVGDVTLTCTVADKWDPISNPVDVVIHVGTPAPAPVAPATTPAPACDNANGKCVLSVTGGSLATPMSSGLAAVVLLVAAGAGILVVRRRTSLAG